MLRLPDEQLTSDAREALRREFLLAAPEFAEQARRIRQLLKRPPPAHTLVLRERPEGKGRPTHIHARGEYLGGGADALPATPASLPPLPDALPRNRLGLARWLTAREHPLTARVTVNRQWGALFGAGIVTTMEDFGAQGAPPTDQPLLDWLAVEFIERGWSLKQLRRLLVTSATYRQSSRVQPEALAMDPANAHLARMSRRRLDAELVLDATLSSSGLLSYKMGGPGVRPPQPAGVTEVAYGNPTWTASAGEDRHRRSIYTLIKRTAPFAAYQTFDAPSAAACVARREVSNTPLQALVLLNDVLLQEAARRLGGELAARPEDDAARVDYAVRRVLTRHPAEDERRDLLQFLVEQRRRLESGGLDAAPLAGGAPEGTSREALVERAAWTALARALLCLDEAITRN